MKENLHGTQLEMFHKCPYKYKYDDSPIPLEFTQIGNLVHMCAEGTKPTQLESLVEYFVDNFCSDFSTKQMLYELMWKTYKWWERNKDFIFISEKKLVGKWNEDYCINSTPDVVLTAQTEKGLGVKIIDFKTTKINQYQDNKLREEVVQPYVYSWLVMEYLKIDETIFSYYLLDKQSRKEKEIKKKINRNEVEKRLNMVISKYDEAVKTGEYIPRQNKFCFFCPLQSCPLNKKKTKEKDILF